jgi:hypothetical protein
MLAGEKKLQVLDVEDGRFWAEDLYRDGAAIVAH